MIVQRNWGGKPYYPISLFYKEHFGEKVQRIPVSVATDCPNRRGLKGMQTCVFCDAWGSAAYPELQGQPLVDQLRQKKLTLGKRYNAHTFLVYFQSYTNTFLGIKKLRESYDLALAEPDVRGMVIGTRPDCLSDGVLSLWTELAQKTFVSVELGVQSFFDDQLDFLKRGHSAQASIDAIEKIKSKTTVDLGIHLIFGIPGETDETIVETARLVSRLPVDNVKLHHLHVLKNTKLETLYREGLFTPVSLEEYTRKVTLFLQHLSPHIAIQRLAALSSHWEELIAPEWTKHKMKVNFHITSHMVATNATQGQYFA